ncbi:coiled-coil domain-containing protein 157 [Pangasianodon hypophthalmus]|uniref:coiled-coil domain-containing protein 157 n=1 Tax=Pangasianodon hypophthalmus TaxID=310915 RepID=UPI002307FC8D|nr:coiled-coil domain-containing protein 157 [Pangasianodon hypophthalmus]
MSHLLGAQDCVESLRRDVIDLQGALVEVFSRTGPVRFRSWKFPDKESCDLDLVLLLEQYDYREGEEEFNQHSHTVLLELVIDRLLLLLQSFNAYTEQMLGGQRAGDCGKAGGSVCVGPVVKRYWNNLIHFSSQQRRQRTSSASRMETSSSSSSTHPDPRISSSTSQRSAPSSSPSCSLHTSPTPSARCRSVSCQTVESALVPCDACAGVQATLQDSARAVASLCQALGLSCSLWSFLQAVEETLQLGRLSACDLALWAREQQRDLGRIQKHVTHVQEKVESLTHSLQKAEEERDELRAQLQREKETNRREREERRRREEEWERTLQEEKHRRDEELRTQQEAQEELRRGAAALEVKISELKGESELQRETQQCLERERDSLVDEVHRLRLEEVRWKEMEEKKRNLEMELSDTQKLLDKESAKYHSAQRQHEAMAVKQRALLERVDALVQQCEELQSRLEECEDEKTELTDTLTHTTQERNTLQEQLTQQKSELLSLNEDREKQCVRLRELEECVSGLTEDLQQAEERERILVAFPELNPQHTTPQSTGDVLCDMEQQLKANSMRIRVLEQENASLTNSLAKLKHTPTFTLRHQSAGDQTPCPDSESLEAERREGAKETQITSSAASSSSSALHHQTLCLSVVPDAGETYRKLRQAARARSAGRNRRRK